MKQKIISLFVTAVLVLLLLAPVAVYGTVEQTEGEAALLQEGEYSIESASSVQYATLPLSVDAETFIYNQLKAKASSINLTVYRVSVDSVGALYSDVINDNPDLFYVSSTYGLSYYPSNNTAAVVTPYYAGSIDDIEQAERIFNSGVSKALAEIDSSMTDFQKALTLHDYICSYAAYPALSSNGTSNDLDLDIYHSAYGFFYDNRVVCAGYTLAYSYLLKQAGVDCEYVGSESMHHAWNKVKIDGKWYNADLTFDDLNYFEDANTYGSVRHKFFLKSDSCFSSIDGSFHYDGKTYDSCECTDTSFDTAFYDDVNSRMYVVDGYIYYLDPAYSSTRVILMKRDVNGNETQVGSYYYATTTGFVTQPTDSSGTAHEVSFDEILAKLAYLDGRFYILASKKLYSQLLDGYRYNITSFNDYSAGLAVLDGNLVLNALGLSEEGYFVDNGTVVLDKLEYFNTYLSKPVGGTYNNYPDINLDKFVNAKDYALITQ
ncbi:MAG: hypothetical protein J5964_01905 [Eubacterium sp.]|nr:hypothetical protein [Eubacterium sp.]